MKDGNSTTEKLLGKLDGTTFAERVERLLRPRWPRAWKRGGLSWQELARRVVRQAQEDQILGRAAQLAYYFLLSVFPLLLFLTALLGYAVEQNVDLREELFAYLRDVIPSQAALDLVMDTLQEVRESRGGAQLSLGLLLALWLSSNGMSALIIVLNAAYDHKDGRPWWQRRLLALALTLVFALMMVVVLAAVFYSGKIGSWLAAALGIGQIYQTFSGVALWLLIVLGLVLVFDVVYNFAPHWGRCDRRWATPGALVGVALWLAGSWAFRLYLHYFDTYTRAYGSLGAVIVLMTWFLITGLVLLIGGEINSEICKAEAEGT